MLGDEGDGVTVSQRRVAVVAAGGGARGAYEAGALAELVPALVAAGQRPTVFVGTSAGSINAVLLASVAHRFGSAEDARAATGELVDLWTSVRCADVFRPLIRSGPGTLRALLAELLRAPGPRLTGLLDTSPFERTAAERVRWDQLHANVTSGAVEAVAVAATSPDGWTRLFLEQPAGAPVPGQHVARGIDYCPTPLEPAHLRASCAIPVVFPPVLVGQPAEVSGWYTDGGVRLNAPLKPALALGADALVVVASHPVTRSAPAPPAPPGPAPEIDDVLAQVFDALLADRLVEDLLTLSTVNDVLASGGRGGQPSPSGQGYSEVSFIAAAPTRSDVLGRLAEDSYARQFSGCAGRARALRQPDLPVLRRLLGGGEGARAGDLLSYVYFDPAFTAPAAAHGREDARRLLRTPGVRAEGLPWRQHPA